ncbi:MAG: hypothetical protein NUW01_11950 [Gemmatimonadaceae bacterium]|nr:hypothetical protein [Gemmatimonadaceae bacterium]
MTKQSDAEPLSKLPPPPPPNFARIVNLNEAGEFPTGDPTDLEAGANRCAVTSLLVLITGGDACGPT